MFCCCLIVRIRYKNQLSPDVVKKPWEREEDLSILAGQAHMGNRWAEM
jgi:hypothetical protein